MKVFANALQVGLLSSCALLSGCNTMGPMTLASHKSRLSVFAARKDAVMESRTEQMGTNPVRVSLVSFLDLRSLQNARGVEIAVRSGGFPVYVDDDEMAGLLKGVDEICSADVDPTATQVVQKFFRTRDGVGVSISNVKNETPACIELGGENVHVTMDELKSFGRMLHEAQGKLISPTEDRPRTERPIAATKGR
jgi:hypothetical protein